MPTGKKYSDNKTDIPSHEALVQTLENVSDLFEFYENWPRLKPLAVELLKNRSISNTDKLTLTWLMHLADRITRRDIENPD